LYRVVQAASRVVFGSELVSVSVLIAGGIFLHKADHGNY
jgi:hypothetical protein